MCQLFKRYFFCKERVTKHHGCSMRYFCKQTFTCFTCSFFPGQCRFSYTATSITTEQSRGECHKQPEVWPWWTCDIWNVWVTGRFRGYTEWRSRGGCRYTRAGWSRGNGISDFTFVKLNLSWFYRVKAIKLAFSSDCIKLYWFLFAYNSTWAHYFEYFKN